MRRFALAGVLLAALVPTTVKAASPSAGGSNPAVSVAPVSFPVTNPVVPGELQTVQGLLFRPSSSPAAPRR